MKIHSPFSFGLKTLRLASLRRTDFSENQKKVSSATQIIGKKSKLFFLTLKNCIECIAYKRNQYWPSIILSNFKENLGGNCPFHLTNDPQLTFFSNICIISEAKLREIIFLQGQYWTWKIRVKMGSFFINSSRGWEFFNWCIPIS